MTPRRKKVSSPAGKLKTLSPWKRKQDARKKSFRRKLWLLGLSFCMICIIFLYSILHARVLEARQKRGREVALTVLGRTSLTQDNRERYAEAISRAALLQGLNPAVVAAIVVVESSGNPLTVSGTGDLGLMQVNVKVHARDFDFQNHNLLNPEENIEVGVSILKTMWKRHGEAKAIAAYNGLLPEKQSYAGKVQDVLSKAGVSQDRQTVAYAAPVSERLGDWWEAARRLSQF
jgi:soluble lytic murein transglycosylase-like protein